MSDDERQGDDHEPGIDLVAGPVRYPRSPIIALALLALVPALALVTVQRWADGEADDYDRSRAELAAQRAAATPSTTTTTLAEIYEPIDDPSGTAAGVDAGAPDGPADPDGGDLETPTTVVVPDVELAQPLLELRRAPKPVVDRANAALLADTLNLALPFYGARSCVAVSVGGLAVADHNPDLPVIPASTQKLVVAATALDVLGSGYRFRTEVIGPPPDADGVVDGDVYLVGGGDPVLTSDDFPLDQDPLPAFNTTSLDALAVRLADAGVERISGSILGDGARYDDEFAVDSWGDGVAFVEAGPYDALLVNDARGVGRSGRDDVPSAGAAREFARVLGTAGIRLDGGSDAGDLGAAEDRPRLVSLATIESAPLPDIVAEMLTTSDNDTAEMLLKELGYVDSGRGTRIAGLAVVERVLGSWGISTAGVRMVDGSGLSPANRMTCRALLAVVQRGTGGPMERGAAVAGRTGTLAEEFTESEAAGRMRAKTGTLGNPPFDADPPAAKGLAGWMTTSGPTIEFVVILNDDDITENRKFAPLWTALADRLATYPAGLDTDDLEVVPTTSAPS